MAKYLLLVCLLPLNLFADSSDTLQTQKVELDEVLVIGFKEKTQAQHPLSTTSLNSRFLKNNEITNVKELSALIPNFYMPDYGSKQNSSVYIRGIGSKTSAPSVGYYIDGIPHLEKSAFDIDLSEISNLEILRGPQGTLYGRNSIGGIINIYTHSPLEYQGSRIKAGYGNYNDASIQFSSYKKVNRCFGFSATGKYHHNDGFFTNNYTGKKADKTNESNARMGIVWKPATYWTLRFTTSYDYSNQGGYPYGPYNSKTLKAEPVNYNRQSMYRRSILTSGVNAYYEGVDFSFNSQTSYQYMHDRQGIDQDFTPEDKSYIIKKTRQNMYSQEITFKSNGQKSYEWIAGTFAFIQNLDNKLDYTLFEQGYSTPRSYDIPIYGIAFYHQSTLHVYKGLSILAGLRYDYEHAREHYVQYKQPLDGKNATSEQPKQFNSKLSFTRLTPKLTIQYCWSPRRLLYASFSTGYKTGGFNTIFQTDDERTYRPEENRNYELGAQFSYPNHKLSASVSLFYIDWRDQQITQTIPGTGNILRNAGHSESKGLEFSLTGEPLPSLTFSLNYGYTYARFLSYKASEKNDYSGNFLPMVPRHTLSLNHSYTIYSKKKMVDKVVLSTGITATGPIFWNEDNKMQQKFYALLNAKASFSKGKFTWEVWGKNLSCTNYLSYYFVSNGAYAQKGKPMTLGTSLIINL